jgi:hypothetical protein
MWSSTHTVFYLKILSTSPFLAIPSFGTTGHNRVRVVDAARQISQEKGKNMRLFECFIKKEDMKA